MSRTDRSHFLPQPRRRAPAAKRIPFALFCAAGLFVAGNAFAQDNIFSSEFDAESSTAPLRQWPTPFAKELAKRLDVPIEKLEKLEKNGYGRTEMISFVAISRKSPKTWEDLYKQREKGTRLRVMAEEAGLDYNALFRDSRALKRQVENAAGATAPALP